MCECIYIEVKVLTDEYYYLKHSIILCMSVKAKKLSIHNNDVIISYSANISCLLWNANFFASLILIKVYLNFEKIY